MNFVEAALLNRLSSSDLIYVTMRAELEANNFGSISVQQMLTLVRLPHTFGFNC